MFSSDALISGGIVSSHYGSLIFLGVGFIAFAAAFDTRVSLQRVCLLLFVKDLLSVVLMEGNVSYRELVVHH